MAENEKQFESNIEAFLSHLLVDMKRQQMLDILHLLIWRWIFIHWLGL
ncbi:MAG: hypothetical protein ACLTDT_07390 [Clostridium sp.]